MRLYFEERQWFAPWVYILSLVVGGGGALQMVMDHLGTGGEALTAALIGAAIVLGLGLFVVDACRLITRVDQAELYVRLGSPIPLCWKHIPFSDITESRVVQYRPLRDVGGWGMRFGRFEGQRCRFYNARGNRGLFIRTPKRNYIIGSQDPERLQAALHEFAGSA